MEENKKSIGDIFDHDAYSQDMLLSLKQARMNEYYAKMYCLKLNNEDIEHHCIMCHSNKICIVTLALTHPIHKLEKTIKRIECCIDNVDRLQNKVVGKKKKGGQKLTPNSILCKIECTDGVVYNIYSCIQGTLLEINENLIENPHLCLSHPFSNGFLATIKPDLSKFNNLKMNLLTQEEYDAVVRKGVE